MTVIMMRQQWWWSRWWDNKGVIDLWHQYIISNDKCRCHTTVTPDSYEYHRSVTPITIPATDLESTKDIWKHGMKHRTSIALWFLPGKILHARRTESWSYSTSLVGATDLWHQHLWVSQICDTNSYACHISLTSIAMRVTDLEGTAVGM